MGVELLNEVQCHGAPFVGVVSGENFRCSGGPFGTLNIVVSFML
jgi:hypothetical protein